MGNRPRRPLRVTLLAIWELAMAAVLVRDAHHLVRPPAPPAPPAAEPAAEPGEPE